MNQFLIPIIRTAVPYAVGWVVTWLATLGIVVSDDTRVQLITFASFVVGTLYYIAVKWLEQRWPKLGILLGVPVAPTYGGTSSSDDVTTEDPDPNLDSGVPPDGPAGD